MSYGPQYPSWDEPQPATPAAPSWNQPRPAPLQWEPQPPQWDPRPAAGYAPPRPAGPPAPPRWDPRPTVHPGRYGPPQPAYQQPGYLQAGGAAIAITMRYAPIAFLLGIVKPVLTVDNQPVPAAWKRRIVVPVTAGPHFLHVHVPYLLPRRIGKADLPISVTPGETVSLEYRAPVIAFLRGALGGPPQRYPGLVAAVLLSVVLAVLTLGAGIAAAQSRPLPGVPVARPKNPATPKDTAPAFPVDPTGPAIPAFPGSGGSQGSTTAPERDGEQPKLRPDAPARKVAGATFGAGDKTFTMAFQGWPFAFRAPDTWGCQAARTDVPDALAWLCINERDRSGGERTGIILRTCPATCSAADRARLATDWLGNAPGARKADGSTRFRQLATNRDGKYELILSHFFTDPATGRKYQVGVDAAAFGAKKSAAQKVVNEILSQSSF
ncbi:hypothetical protein GCM10010168_33080 [Actinoplanes ianthinogenes]|uniref:hypothetical protein n=1 Tax=Actinoplanes ianthinogenes TaxID=122358 RepID=UPI00166FAAE5|nr:hypothetical protein [Actinoplanes ianthinogenes]GGR12716.1 hypothetical protein GCM10010168_33080 [Actinoplanes ianthinogenes]